MKPRLSSFIAAAIIAILSPLPGCAETPDDTGGGGTGGSDPGSTSASGSTSSGVGAGGSGGAGSTSASTGGGGSTGSGSEIEPTFETVKFVIENVTCFGAGCHNDDMNPLDLMINEELHTTITSHMSKNCGPLVNLGNPQESALVKVLKGPCGSTPRMPLECVNDEDQACVPPDYIEAITQWIADGALE